MGKAGGILGIIAGTAALLAASGPGRAEDDTKVLVAKGLCSEMIDVINAFDFSHTMCLPALGSGKAEFIFITEKPVFAVEAAKKAWVILVMGAVGSVLNENPKYEVGTVSVADMSMLPDRRYFSIPAQTLKDLQAKVKGDQLDLDGAWRRISAELKPKQLEER